MVSFLGKIIKLYLENIIFQSLECRKILKKIIKK